MFFFILHLDFFLIPKLDFLILALNLRDLGLSDLYILPVNNGLWNNTLSMKNNKSTSVKPWKNLYYNN